MRSWFYLENHPFLHSVLNYRKMDCHAHSSDRKKNSLSGHENSPLKVMLRELYIVVDLQEQSWTFGPMPKFKMGNHHSLLGSTD